MDELPFAEESLDAIWSEGAVYNIGFETGVRQWRRLLRPGGVIAVSELTWTSAIRPVELERYWDAQYAEVATASEKLAILERHGFTPLAYGLLPERCWTDEFYTPLWQRLDEFLDRRAHHDTATALVDEIRDEMSWFERYSAHVGYGFYVARRIDS